MKNVKLFTLAVMALILLASCSSVRVVSDYDQRADFNTYRSYAFYKTGIDKAQISDLDKKRILRAIENELGSRGFVKSENPDVLISIFTKERERVDVYNNNFGWGWGWGPGSALLQWRCILSRGRSACRCLPARRRRASALPT
jgi:hypothetical protein